MVIVDSLISRGYSLEEIKSFSLNQLFSFLILSNKRDILEQKKLASIVKIAISFAFAKNDKAFQQWLTNK